MGNARCRRNSIKPGATPQVHSHQSIVALQAQKKCHPGAMRLLGWPRRSLLSIRVVVGVISMSTSVSGNVFGGVLRITSVVPAALTLRYFCAYSARCPRRGYAWGVAPGCKLLHKTGYALAIRASSWRSACTVFALAAREACGGYSQHV